MAKKLVKADLIRSMLDEMDTSKGIPGNRTLAKMAIEKYPDDFKSIESARCTVRYVTGSHGNNHRTDLKPEHKKYFDLEKWHEAYARDPHDDVWRTPYQIPVFEFMTVIADLHSVHVNKSALSKFFKLTANKEAILINGDLLDSQSLTRHLRVKNTAKYEDEIEMGKQLLGYLKEEFNHVYFKAGNHDYWLERYIANRAPELGGIKGFDLPTILGLAGMGVHYIEHLQPITYGDLDICHGHEFSQGFTVPRRPAMSYLRKWIHYKRKPAKILCSHVHQADHAIEKTYDSKFSEGWTTPAMCLKAAEYARFSMWDNGHTELRNGNDGVDVKNVVYAPD